MPAIVGGMSKLISQLDDIADQITTEDLQWGAMEIIDYAQSIVPVDTGFLRNSAFIQVQPQDVLIGFEAPYASYVEFGTYKMAAQPYLRPAFDEAEGEALAAIRDSIERRWRSTTGKQINTQSGPIGTLEP